MVTNVEPKAGDSFIDLSGVTLRVTRRVQGGKACGDGYLHLVQPSSVYESVYSPAQDITVYLRNAAMARLLAQVFTELAEAIEGEVK